MTSKSVQGVGHGRGILVLGLLSACLLGARVDAQEPSSDGADQGESAEAASRVPMNNGRLGKLLEAHFPERKLEGQPGLWRIDLSKPSEANTEEQPSEEERSEEKKHDEIEEGEEAESQEESALGADNHLPAVLLVLTDERANRMRIMMPIRQFDPQTVEDLQLALIALHANYDRALDARYAIQDGVLWSVFIHPLGSLTPKDLANALKQVQALRENTGTTYSSSELIFGPGQEAPKEEDNQDRLT